jgi:hypothetical protein
VKRYGPSHRRARNASVVFKNFYLHPKKTFSTVSRVDRTCRTSGQTSVFGPKGDIRPISIISRLSEHKKSPGRCGGF